jgi:aspartate kinase
MAGVTNKFVGYVRSLNACEGDPEYDYVVSSGELITAGLVAIALKNLGLEARSYSSWQVPIITDSAYGQAVIQNINSVNLQKDMENGIVPVICGFQGINSENRITTLGRGGSDLTAVAVASALGADVCEIYSDVDGVYTVDPNLYPKAKKIDAVNYCEMLEMASQGAKILQEQSVDYAMKKNVIIRVASGFVDNGGTFICEKTSPRDFCGLAVTPSLLQIRIFHNEGEKNIINLLEKNYIRAEVVKSDHPGRTDLLLDKRKNAIVVNLLKKCDFVKSVRQVVPRRSLSRISVVGSSASCEVGEILVEVLKLKKIETFGSAVGDHHINLVVESGKLTESVAILHKHCGLEK